ncbi:MAG: energy-coupled thiamine transporter ThiT [Christensenellales bacterium]
MQNVFEKIMELKPETWAILVSLIAMAVLLILFRKKWNTRMLAYAAICIAIGFVLSCIRLYRMPQGGSVTPGSMFPVMLFSWAFGPTAGITASVAYGLLQLLQDFYAMHPVSLIMDYVLAFGMLGLTGFFKKNLTLGIFVAGVGRWLWHFLSGFIFFAEYAWEGWNPVPYSAVYNLSVIGPDLLICIALSLIPRVKRFAETFRNNAQPIVRESSRK